MCVCGVGRVCVCAGVTCDGLVGRLGLSARSSFAFLAPTSGSRDERSFARARESGDGLRGAMKEKAPRAGSTLVYFREFVGMRRVGGG